MTAIFISYARADGTELAKRLFFDLEAVGYAVWRDEVSLDVSRPFDYAIEQAIKAAPALIVLVTPDVNREDSFVRREIAFALEVNTPIIPLKCAGGIIPITINLLTFIPFGDYDKGFPQILERLKRPSNTAKAPETLRERELHYLQDIGEKFERWLYLYTDMSGRAHPKPNQPKANVKAHALKYLNTENFAYTQRGYAEDGDTQKVETVNELREVVREGGVVLIGEPGSGKTTTLQRLAYEFAIEAVDDETKPIPVFVPLGAYSGGPFEAHIAQYMGDLPLAHYLPKRIVLLLDGLNEMPPQHIETFDTWLRGQLSHQLKAVVTCRRLDYAALKQLPLRRVDVAPLDVTRIRMFIGNFLEDDDRDRLFWALAGENVRDLWDLFQRNSLDFEAFWFGNLLQSGHPAYNSTSRGQDTRYNQMRATMQENSTLPALLGLVSNPFLLNITIEVFITTGQPPYNRGQLFRDFVELLIEKRGKPAASPQHPWIEADIQKAALAALAYQMQADKMGTSVPLAWAKTVLLNNGISYPDQLLYLAQSATLLILDSNTQEIKFVHQLLGEYFAAVKMGEDMAAGVTPTRYWPNGWPQPSGWEETAVLLAGMQKGVADWLLLVHPILACRAVTEGIAQPDLHARLQTALVEAMTDETIRPIFRAEAGRIINRLGDPRAGVGLRPDGLPDIAWCEVPAGDFLYGNNQEKRTIPYTYWISQYPVTNAQFQAFLDAPDGYNNREWWTAAGWGWKGERTAPDEYGDPAFRLPNHPRIYVRWYEALAFAHWLGHRLGQKISLPTEEEWEKAARGTDGRVYPWGDAFEPDKCNSSVGEQSIGQTSAVGLFLSGQSPYQVFDMSGNVWEWCLTDYQSEDNDIEDTNSRVLRGGAWDNYNDYYLRAAHRNWDNPVSRGNYGGFRLARS